MSTRICVFHRVPRAVRIEVQCRCSRTAASVCVLRHEHAVFGIVVSCVQIVQACSLVIYACSVAYFIVERRCTVFVICLRLSVIIIVICHLRSAVRSYDVYRAFPEIFCICVEIYCVILACSCSLQYVVFCTDQVEARHFILSIFRIQHRASIIEVCCDIAAFFFLYALSKSIVLIFLDIINCFTGPACSFS